MELAPEDFDRLRLADQTRRAAEIKYAENPLDAENLVKWGGSLLDLSQFENPSDFLARTADAISKLEEALTINPMMPDALWRTGNAYTSLGLATSNFDEAKDYYAKATECFERAVAEEPDNDLYRKSLQVAHKAPEMHKAMFKQEVAEQAALGELFAACSKSIKKMMADYEFTYDGPGWIMLAVGVIALLGMR